MLAELQEIGPLPSGLGFAVAVPSLDSLLRAETAAWLRELLTVHGLLVIRAVPLTPVQQVAFSRGFGIVEVLPWQPSQLPDHPEIFRVSNRAEHGLTEVGRSWHSDGAYLAQPREISIFHIVSVPDEGGETEFASLHAAFDAAPPELIERLCGKKSLFPNGITHPIIMRHPVTGRLGFYVKLSASTRILDENVEESRIIFREIQRLIELHGKAYKHRWSHGDIVVADNFSVAHRSHEVRGNSLRILHRTTIIGGGRILTGARKARLC
jgi:taurine dioxygenase